MEYRSLDVIGFDMYEINKNGVVRFIRGKNVIPIHTYKKYEFKPTIILHNRFDNKQSSYFVEDIIKALFPDV